MFRFRTTPSAAGRFDTAYRIGGIVLPATVVALSPWMHLGVPCEDLLETLAVLMAHAGTELVWAAVGLLVLVSGVTAGAVLMVRRWVSAARNPAEWPPRTARIAGVACSSRERATQNCNHCNFAVAA